MLCNRDVITIGGRSFLFRASDDDNEKTVRLPSSSSLEAKDKSDMTLQLAVPPIVSSRKTVETTSHAPIRGLSNEGQSKYRSLGEELLAAIKKRRVSTVDSAVGKSPNKLAESMARPHPAGRRGSKVLFTGTHGVTFSAQLKAAVEERRKKMDSTDSSSAPESAQPRLSMGAMKALEVRRKSMRRSMAREGNKSSKTQDHRLSLKSALHTVIHRYRHAYYELTGI